MDGSCTAGEQAVERFYAKQEVADYFGTTVRHVEALVEKGELAHFRVGRYLRFRRQDLDAYVGRTYVPAKPAA